MKVFFELPEGKTCEDLDICDLTSGKEYDLNNYTMIDDAGFAITSCPPSSGLVSAHLGSVLKWQEVKPIK